MPISLFWGEDEFAIAQAVANLRQQVLDPAWADFNYDKILPEQPEAIAVGLNQALTPPFGTGQRLVWLVDTPLCQRCPDTVLAQLDSTLPAIPETTTLLLTTRSKPDGRLKSTKLLQKVAQIREFPLIPPWKTELLVSQVRQVAQEKGIALTPGATELLAEAVGNNTRQLYLELEKLGLYAGDRPVDAAAIGLLVITSTQSTLQLAAAIREGQTARALDLVADLLRQNEPPIRIVSSLVGQFRTWTWVKLMLESGERNEAAIAQAAEIPNPKRVFFLKKEIEWLSLPALLQTLPLLLELDANLKRGADESALQTTLVELCELCRSG